MAFESSLWGDVTGETPEHGGRSKRLCTGFSNISQPFHNQWASSQIPPEESFSDTYCDDSNGQARSTSAAEFEGVSRQRVGNNIYSQTLFQSHQNAPSPSSGHTARHSWLDIVGVSPSIYHQHPNPHTPLHPSSDACGALRPSSGAIDCQTIAIPDTSNGRYPPGQCQRSDVGSIQHHDLQDSTTDGSSRSPKSGNSEHNNRSYELCLGLVSPIGSA